MKIGFISLIIFVWASSVNVSSASSPLWSESLDPSWASGERDLRQIVSVEATVANDRTSYALLPRTDVEASLSPTQIAEGLSPQQYFQDVKIMANSLQVRQNHYFEIVTHIQNLWYLRYCPGVSRADLFRFGHEMNLKLSDSIRDEVLALRTGYHFLTSSKKILMGLAQNGLVIGAAAWPVVSPWVIYDLDQASCLRTFKILFSVFTQDSSSFCMNLALDGFIVLPVTTYLVHYWFVKCMGKYSDDFMTVKDGLDFVEEKTIKDGAHLKTRALQVLAVAGFAGLNIANVYALTDFFLAGQPAQTIALSALPNAMVFLYFLISFLSWLN